MLECLQEQLLAMRKQNLALRQVRLTYNSSLMDFSFLWCGYFCVFFLVSCIMLI